MTISFTIGKEFLVSLGIFIILVAIAYRVYLGDLTSAGVLFTVICSLAFYFHVDLPTELLSKFITKD